MISPDLAKRCFAKYDVAQLEELLQRNETHLNELDPNTEYAEIIRYQVEAIKAELKQREGE